MTQFTLKREITGEVGEAIDPRQPFSKKHQTAHRHVFSYLFLTLFLPQRRLQDDGGLIVGLRDAGNLIIKKHRRRRCYHCVYCQ